MKPVNYLREAEAELVAAITYYEAQREGLGKNSRLK